MHDSIQSGPLKFDRDEWWIQKLNEEFHNFKQSDHTRKWYQVKWNENEKTTIINKWVK